MVVIENGVVSDGNTAPPKTPSSLESVRRRYAMFINNNPIAVFVITTLLLGVLTVLGFQLAPVPDFSDPKAGFETRGTILSERILTWKHLENKISFYPDQRKDFFRQLPPNTLQRRRRAPKISPNKSSEHPLEQLFFTALTSSPCLQLNVPVAVESYSQVVFEIPSTKSLFNLDTILELCDLQQKINRTLRRVKIRLEQNHFWSLPNYITCFSGEFSCSNLKEKDVRMVADNVERCAPYQEEIVACKAGTISDACRRIPEYCNSKYYHDLFNFILSKNVFTNAQGPVYTSIVLPIYSYSTYQYMGRRDINLKKFVLLYEQVSRWPKQLKHVRLAGLNLGIKLETFNYLLQKNTVFVLIGIGLVAAIIWIFSGSLFYTITVLLSMFFSITVAYFVYHLVFRMEFFPFMNLLVVVLLIGVGADDTFVLKYVFDTAKKNDSISPDDMVDAMSYAALSMLITSVTTAAAFFASLSSSVVVIKCFGVFAGTTMLVNYLLVVSFMPASLIILQRYINPLYEKLCPKLVITLINKVYSFGTTFSHFCVQILLPLILQRCKVYLVGAFSLALVSSFFLVFYKPGLSLPKRNPIQLFPPFHPFEWYDDQMEMYFRFALTKYSEPIKISLIWGFVPSQVGSSPFQPYSTGNLAADPNFKASLETLRDLQSTWDRLKTQPALRLDGDCFAHSFFSWSKQQVCTGEGDTCCNYLSKYFSETNVNHCLASFTRKADVFSGGPIIHYGQGVVVGYVMYAKTRFNWSTDYQTLKSFHESVEQAISVEFQAARTQTIKRGFFTTTDHLTSSWYDLQRELMQGTPTSIILSILIAFIVTVCVTRTVVLSFLSILSISAVILNTIAILVLLNWRMSVVESTIIILTIGLSFDYTLHYAVAYKFASLGSREDKVLTVLRYIGMLVTMSAITTFVPGVAMILSSIMAYKQIGSFMTLMSVISWTNATLGYLSLLAIWGPQRSTLSARKCLQS